MTLPKSLVEERDRLARFGEADGDAWPRTYSEQFHFKEGFNACAAFMEEHAVKPRDERIEAAWKQVRDEQEISRGFSRELAAMADDYAELKFQKDKRIAELEAALEDLIDLFDEIERLDHQDLNQYLNQIMDARKALRKEEK